MSIEFNCEICGKHFKVSDAMAGKRAKCKECGGIIRVPSVDDGPPNLSAIEMAAGGESPSPLELVPRRTEASIPTQPPASCPSCHAPLSRGAVLCTVCGFDTRKGVKIRGIKSNKPTTKAARNGKEIKWWIMILIGVVMIPFSIHEYNDLGRWEAEGGYRVLDSLTSVAYHTFGRIGVLVVGLLLSFFLIGAGLLIRASEWKKSTQHISSSPLKDVLDAAVVLKTPLSKLVLLGLVLGNFLLVAAVLGMFGFVHDDIKQWFLPIFFGALALSLAEFSLWDRLVRKFDDEHHPDNRLQIGGIIVSLMLGIFFLYQTHSEAKEAIEQQKRADATQAEMRRMNNTIKDAGPALEHIREMQAAREIQAAREARAAAAANNPGSSRSAVPTSSPSTITSSTSARTSPTTPPPEPPVPDEPGPAWTTPDDQLALLGREVAIGAYAVRPPLGFPMQAQLAKGNYRWVSARGMFMVNISDRGERGFHPPIITIRNHALSSPMQQTFIGATKEIGKIGGIPFVRASKDGSTKLLYAGYDGEKLIVISCLVKDPADLTACDAAARTLHKTP